MDTPSPATGRTLLPTVLTPARAVLGAVVVAALVVHWTSRTVPFDSDEANHANLALRQFQDLRDGRWTDFLRHSYRTGQFPFLHGWTVLPFFAALGTTEFAARIAQCLHFVVGTAAAAVAAWRACGGNRRAGFLAGAFFALSPALAVFSGLCMLETPGAAGVALSLVCLGEALRPDVARSWRWHAATAGAVLVTWFTKLNYGMWILPAVGLGYVVHATLAPERRRAIRGLAVYVVTLALVLGAWYAAPSQRAAFHGFLTNPSQAVSVVKDDPTFHLPAFRPDNFTAYFGLVAREFHVHWTVGAAAMLLFAAGVVRAVRERNAVLCAAAGCVAWTWLSLSMGFREYAIGRFIAPALPALWIVAAAGAQPLLDRIGDGLAARIAERFVAGAWLFALVFTLRSALPLEYEVDDRHRPVFDRLVEDLPGPCSVIVVNWTDHLSPRTLSWELAKRPGASYRDFDVKDASGERIYESTRNLDAWMSEPRPWGGPEWASYVVEVVPGPDYVDASALVPETVSMWRDAVQRQADAGRLELVGDRGWGGLGVRIRIWRDRTPPPHLGHGGDGG